MRFDSLHFALIAVVVLLAIYFGGQLVEGNDSRTYKCPPCYGGHTITLPYGKARGHVPYPKHKWERGYYCDLACAVHARRIQRENRRERLHREKLECERTKLPHQICLCTERGCNAMTQ